MRVCSIALTTPSRIGEPIENAPAVCVSSSRTTATDQRGAAGGGAYMIASSLSGSDVLRGPDASLAAGAGTIGGHLEQKMFRLRIWSSCLVVLAVVADRTSRRARRGGGTIMDAIVVVAASAVRTEHSAMTARSAAR